MVETIMHMKNRLLGSESISVCTKYSRMKVNMKKAIAMIFAVLIIMLTATGCEARQNNNPGGEPAVSDAPAVNIGENAKEEQSAANDAHQDQAAGNTEQDADVIAEALYKNLYIGETLESGYIYIEPFNADRKTVNEAVAPANYPDAIKFYSVENGDSSFSASFDSSFDYYVPQQEESSIYFTQSFSQPKQYGLKYKLDKAPDKAAIGLAVFEHEISGVDCSIAGNKRSCSQEEYDNAVKAVAQDKAVPEGSRTLSNIEMDNTIVGAQLMCSVKIKDSNVDMILSKYFTHDTEYAAQVYVIDFVKDGKVVKTYEKHNWDGPY